MIEWTKDLQSKLFSETKLQNCVLDHSEILQSNFSKLSYVKDMYSSRRNISLGVMIQEPGKESMYMSL